MQGLIIQIAERAKEIMLAPANDPIMLWELVPLVFTLIIIELYFGRYKQEKLGWNSAVSNSLVLIFVGSNLLHFLYLEGRLEFLDYKTFIPLVLMSFGILMATLDFFHLLPVHVAFGISSVLPVNFSAFIGIILVHTCIPFDIVTFYASIALFILLAVIFMVIHFCEKKEFG